MRIEKEERIMRTITICSSASFYKQALEAQEELQKRGFRILIPDTAQIMKQRNNFDVSVYKTWFANDSDWNKKTELMNKHFKKVLESEAILVLNYEKNGMAGYIGGNVLMEMAIAFHYKKPIFVLNPVNEKLPAYEEVLGMKPFFLKGELKNLVLEL